MAALDLLWFDKASESRGNHGSEAIDIKRKQPTVDIEREYYVPDYYGITVKARSRSAWSMFRRMYSPRRNSSLSVSFSRSTGQPLIR